MILIFFCSNFYVVNVQSHERSVQQFEEWLGKQESQD